MALPKWLSNLIGTKLTSFWVGRALFDSSGLSADRTFTLPDANGTLLYSGGPLGTPASGTLTNATGLPIASGVSGLGTGVATFLATPSSANLAAAVTDETGTGALVFANSPTLVTPALGTPSGAVLTNATGLPLSTGVTGTLPKANGGTAEDNSTGGTANTFWARPNGATGAASYRAIVAADVPTLNQNTTGSAATLTTPRAIYGNNFDGSAALTQVIASTYGGTGNGFTKFSGPTTSEKTFTLPDASAAILTDNAAVTVAQGGTGRATGTTAYALIATGTTATGAQQTLAAGATTEILVGGGASALPVWTTATGSGAPVRATSPTLTTPNIGTPSAGTLTNCTGLPIAGLVASTSTALGVGSIELGHASDTTITRTSAGNIAVEGNAIYRAGGTDVPVADGGTGASTAVGARAGLGFVTLNTTATSGTVTIDCSADNVTHVLSLTGNVTIALSNEADGRRFLLYIRGQASGYTITWFSGIKWVGGAAPTIPTTSGRVMAIGFIRLASGEWIGAVQPEAY